MESPKSCRYAFDRFHFDPLRGRLDNGGMAIDLRPKSLAVLAHLVTHPHRLVSKDELLAAVWGHVVVTEDSLVQCVGEIRQALGDDDQRLIRTIPRRGYMFVADVVEQPASGSSTPAATAKPPHEPASVPHEPASVPHEPASAPYEHAMRRNAWKVGATLATIAVAALAFYPLYRNEAPQANGTGARADRAQPPRLSIAVLPLVNIDKDPAHDYFADGLTQDLTTDLSRIPASFVISRSSVVAYKDKPIDNRIVGRDLGVRYVLEGSVQRLGDDVRVNLRLVEAETGAQLWAERFEGPRGELPRMQVDIVRRIARTLQIQLVEAEAERSLRERTANADASDLVMRGWALWERRHPLENAKARDLFARATVLDPSFSTAWVGLASTHLSALHSGWSDNREQLLRDAEAALNQAYTVGPRNRDVNASRGYVLFFKGEVELALAAFDNEIDANPGNALAHVWRGLMLITLQRPAEALAPIERGILLSPRDGQLNVFYRSMAHAYFSLARYDEAVNWAEKATVNTPGYTKGYAFLAAAAALKGDGARARSAIDEFRRLQPKYDSVVAFKSSMMPGEVRMFDATPRFWEALQKAGLSYVQP